MRQYRSISYDKGTTLVGVSVMGEATRFGE